MTTTCAITVDVDPDGHLVCSPNPLVVTDPDSLITFSLLPPGYEFPSADAIVLSERAAATFPYPSWTVKSSLSAVLDLNTVNGRFPYTVTVIESNSGRRLQHDPVITNDR